MDAPEIHRTKDSDIAFRDPLSEESRKTRTHLMFVGVLAVLVKTYDLKVTKAPWLEIDVPPNAPQILEGALSAALCYFLFVFGLYAWQDFRRWRLAGDIHLVHGSFDLILNSRNDLFVISQHLDKIISDQPLQSAIRAAVEAAAKRIPESQSQLVSLRAALHRLNWLQWFRVVVVEVAIPLALGLLGLYKVFSALAPFVAAVMK